MSLRDELAAASGYRRGEFPAWERVRAVMDPDEFVELASIINDKSAPPSATAIVKVLKARGIDVARSTVENWVEGGVPE